jgi:hypothetical protein
VDDEEVEEVEESSLDPMGKRKTTPITHTTATRTDAIKIGL